MLAQVETCDDYCFSEDSTTVVFATPLSAILDEQRQRFGEGCVIIDKQFIENLREGLPEASTNRVKEGKFCFV